MALLPYFNFKPFGKSIYNRRSNTMKTSGYLISSTTKFSTCMKHSKYNFNCRLMYFRMNINGYSTTIIYYSYRIVLMNSNIYVFTVSSNSFINRIIYNFINKMMKSSWTCTSNIHAWSFSNCF